MIVFKKETMEDPLKPELQEVGTRWQHYAELRELFAVGVEILKHLNVKSSVDWEKQKKLEGAIELIDGRIGLLANYTQGTTWGSRLRTSVDYDVEALYMRMKREREIHEKENEHGAGPASNSPA